MEKHAIALESSFLIRAGGYAASFAASPLTPRETQRECLSCLTLTRKIMKKHSGIRTYRPYSSGIRYVRVLECPGSAQGVCRTSTACSFSSSTEIDHRHVRASDISSTASCDSLATVCPLDGLSCSWWRQYGPLRASCKRARDCRNCRIPTSVGEGAACP